MVGNIANALFYEINTFSKNYEFIDILNPSKNLT